MIVCADALRADRAAALPNLARFAAEAFVFETAVAQAPWTLPSMMSVFTSLPPSRHGLVNDLGEAGGETLAGDVLTLPEALKRAGYATAAFTGGAGMGGAYGFARGFDVYFEGGPFTGFDVTAPKAMEWVRANADRKFFLLVHGYDVHGQWAGGDEASRAEFLALRGRALAGRRGGFSTAERELWARRYDERAARLDERLGALFDGLRAVPGLWERTAVVFLSDHGDELMEHGGFDHGLTLYDELLRVPLIVRVPGAPAGRAAAQARLVDVMPTALDLLGVKVPRNLEGRSLRPALRGRPRASDAYAETDYLRQVSKRSLRTADGWKLIADLVNDGRELYDLNRDPGETEDLFEREPGTARRLEEALFRRRE